MTTRNESSVRRLSSWVETNRHSLGRALITAAWHDRLARTQLWQRMRSRLVPLAIARRSRNGVLALDISSGHGIGLKLEWCLELLAYCHEQQLEARFKFSYPNSAKQEDYFGSFFSMKGNANRATETQFTVIRHINEVGLKKDYDKVLSLELAAHLVEKHLSIKPEIVTEVDDFCFKHFGSKRVLGVHYRGTDKVTEAPPVPYDKLKRNIEGFFTRFPEADCIFLTTDDRKCISYLKESGLKKPLIVRDDAVRSESGVGVHFVRGVNRYAMNRDAIVNCLILSRCYALMKSASFLSDWAKLFNPKIPLIMLNRPYVLYFPEREFVKSVLYDPIE